MARAGHAADTSPPSHAHRFERECSTAGPRSGRIEKSREDDDARGGRCPDTTLGTGEARGVPSRYECAVSRRFAVDSHAEARALRAATRHVERNVGRLRRPSRSAMLVMARRCVRRARPVPMHLCTVGSSTGVPVEADIQRQECTASSRVRNAIRATSVSRERRDRLRWSDARAHPRGRPSRSNIPHVRYCQLNEWYSSISFCHDRHAVREGLRTCAARHET